MVVESSANSVVPGGVWGQRLFKTVKYLTFAFLTLNIFLFFDQELESARHSLNQGFHLAQAVQLFSATLDTAAWVVLLLLFEVETAIIPDQYLVGWTKRSIHGVRLICGAAIVSAWFGYVGEWQVFLGALPAPAAACDLVGGDWSVLLDFDDFVPLSADNCALLPADTLQVSGLEQVLAAPAAFASAAELALVDVINAGAWILVVVVLEVEVRQQLHGGIPKRWKGLMGWSKIAIYSTLALAAIYWGIEGDFLDFWDAALWLFAFVFIEMNVFDWQFEQHAKQQGT